MNKKNKFLIVVDGSYWLYFTLYGAVDLFKKRYPTDYNYWIKPIDEIKENQIPNLINCENFKKVLKTQTMKRCETIDWLAKQNCQTQLDMVDDVDILFALDDRVSHNFRKKLYPEYKAQRALKKQQFKIQEIKDYILNVLWETLDLEKKFGFKKIQVENAEGDDIVACILKNFRNQYQGSLLLASDHDYLQIEDILEIDLMGRKHEPKLVNEILSGKDFLLSKILLGDVADNICHVFKGYGQKKVLNLIKNKSKLKTLLLENQDAAKQYLINKKIISFDEIPKDLEEKINEKINETIYNNDLINKNKLDDEIDLAKFMDL